MPPVEELGITVVAFLLGLQAIFYSGLLYCVCRKETCVLLWSVACLDVAGIAILSGIQFGWRNSMDLPEVLWPITVFLLSYLSLFLAIGAAQSSIRNPARRKIKYLLIAKFITSLFYLGTRVNIELVHVLWDYVSALVLVILFKAYTKLGRSDPSSTPILIGASICLLSLPILAGNFYSNTWVNQYTIFFLLQMVAFHFFYMGSHHKTDQ
jgi:hypothetical protein